MVKQVKGSSVDYATPMFENEEAFIERSALNFVHKLQEVREVRVEVNSRELAEAIVEKAIAMGELMFRIK